MIWITKLGAWLCRRGRHKMKSFVSMDFAKEGSAVTTGKACTRCNHVVVDSFKRDVVSELSLQMKNHRKDILLVTDLAGSQATRVLQDLTKTNEVNVVLKPITFDKVIIDEIRKKYNCPLCGSALTPGVIFKNGYECKDCGTSFGKYQLEALESFESPPAKSGEELLRDALTSGSDWTTREADPKADMTIVIKECHPLHRACIIEGFDPDHIVWTDEERKEMLEAPMLYDEDVFEPLKIHMSKENIDLFEKLMKDKSCIHCGRGLFTVHEQDRGECSRCEEGDGNDK